MEHLIKEIFLVVPNLTWRVAEGQYDLCSPQDEILTSSNWGSMIEPGWEITMRMWPNPERPPWEYAGPMAMLQDRHDIKPGRQSEPQFFDSEHPQLGELKRYRSAEARTQHLGGFEIEEQGPQARSELRRKPLNLVSGQSQDSDECEGDHSTKVPFTRSANQRLREPKVHHRRKPTAELVGDVIVEERRSRTYIKPPRKSLSHRGYDSETVRNTTFENQKVSYEHSETPQSRELGPYQTEEQRTERDSENSLLPRGSLYEADMKEIERRLERIRSSASVRTPTIGYNNRADDRYHSPPRNDKPSKGDRKQKQVIAQKRGN